MPMEDQEVLNFYGERDNVTILDCEDLESSKILCCRCLCALNPPRPPSSAYLFLIIEDLASYL